MSYGASICETSKIMARKDSLPTLTLAFLRSAISALEHARTLAGNTTECPAWRPGSTYCVAQQWHSLTLPLYLNDKNVIDYNS